MIVDFPPPPNAGAYTEYLRRLCYTIKQSFVLVASNREAVDKILLRSPNGSVFDVTVNNAGAITVTAHDSTERY